MAVLLITHDMGVVAGRADRVAVMYAGRIVEEAATTTLFHSVRHRYTEALLDAIPRFDQDRSEELYSIPGMPPDLTNPPPACRFSPRCRFVTSVCTEVEPELAELEPGHRFACHHPAGHQAPRLEAALPG